MTALLPLLVAGCCCGGHHSHHHGTAVEIENDTDQAVEVLIYDDLFTYAEAWIPPYTIVTVAEDLFPDCYDIEIYFTLDGDLYSDLLCVDGEIAITYSIVE